jgi:uncharacterized protein (TIGR02246 family)
MKPSRHFAYCLALSLINPGIAGAEEPSPELDGLRKAATEFVQAYNRKDAASLAAMFTENGEITDVSAEDITSGRDAIKARYEEIFADPKAPEMAIEVASVRFVTPTVAIEDGTYYLDLPGDDSPVIATAYTATLTKSATGTWQVASTRSLKDVTAAEDQLAELATNLKGEWVCTREGVKVELVFGWDDSGKFLSGEAVVTKPDSDPLTSTIRIGWDGARKGINWWIFDNEGGFSKAAWTASDDGWLSHGEGTTAEGEATSANGHVVFDGEDTMIWKTTNRLVNGESLPDIELRLVRRAPPPAEEEPAAEDPPNDGPPPEIPATETPAPEAPATEAPQPNK